MIAAACGGPALVAIAALSIAIVAGVSAWRDRIELRDRRRMDRWRKL